MTERHKIICAAYLFLLKDNKILLLRRLNTGYEDGNYSVPAGHTDEGESILSTLLREVKEEIDLNLTSEDVKFVHVMHRAKRTGKDANDERLDFFFVCNKWEGEVKNLEPDKCDDLSWFNINELPVNTIPYIKDAIENYRNNTYYSEQDWQK